MEKEYTEQLKHYRRMRNHCYARAYNEGFKAGVKAESDNKERLYEHMVNEGYENQIKALIQSVNYLRSILAQYEGKEELLRNIEITEDRELITYCGSLYKKIQEDIVCSEKHEHKESTDDGNV